MENILQHHNAEFLSRKYFTHEDEKLFEYNDVNLWYETLLRGLEWMEVLKYGEVPDLEIKFQKDVYQKQLIIEPKDIHFKIMYFHRNKKNQTLSIKF